jgi:hypothetical protein
MTLKTTMLHAIKASPDPRRINDDDPRAALGVIEPAVARHFASGRRRRPSATRLTS